MFVYVFPILLAAVLALLCQFDVIKSNRYIFGIFIFALALFGGLRFEVGQDWPNYKIYFEQIDVSLSPVSSYFSNLANLQFEIGYFFVNYYVKLIGLGYWAVFLSIALFLGYAIYSFTKNLDLNKYYLLVIYISYCFIILNFAQARQSIAVAFFFLACSFYLKNKKVVKTVIIASLGLFFQFSAIIYIVLFLLTVYFPKSNKYKILLVVILPLAFILSQSFGIYAVMKIFVPAGLENKIDIYEEEQGTQGQGQLIYGAYILATIIYNLYYRKLIKSEEFKFISNYTTFSLALAILTIFIFPGNYVMYSRLYIVASIFQGISIGLIFNQKKDTYWHHIFVLLTVAIAIYSYVRIVYMYDDEYLPYKSIIDNLFYL